MASHTEGIAVDLEKLRCRAHSPRHSRSPGRKDDQRKPHYSNQSRHFSEGDRKGEREPDNRETQRWKKTRHGSHEEGEKNSFRTSQPSHSKDKPSYNNKSGHKTYQPSRSSQSSKHAASSKPVSDKGKDVKQPREGRKFTLKNVVTIIKSVVDWYQLGIQLDREVYELKIIKTNHSNNVVAARTEMINHWIDNDKDASWKKLAEALEKVEQNKLANEIRQEQGISDVRSKTTNYGATENPPDDLANQDMRSDAVKKWPKPDSPEPSKSILEEYKKLDDFTTGKTIRLRGVAPDSGRFSVNIFNAHKPDDIIFHFNPRFDQGCVVRNSRFQGTWGQEEKDGGMVFTSEKEFILSITLKPDVFHVLVDDQFFCEYRHRCEVPHLVLLEFDCGVEYY